MRISDWSSDVCSSDLCKPLRNCRWIGCCAWARHCVATKPRRVKSTFGSRLSRSSVMESSRGQPRGVPGDGKRGAELWPDRDRKSVVEGKIVSVRVDLGGRRILKKKKQQGKRLK